MTQKDLPAARVWAKSWTLCLLFVLGFGGCNWDVSKDNTTPGPPVSQNLTRQAQEIWPELEARLFKPSCVSCHNSQRPAAGIDLSSRASLQALMVSRPQLVVPGAPDQSVLHQVIVTGRMPPGGRAVDGLELLREWILVLGQPQGSAPGGPAKPGIPGDGTRPDDRGAPVPDDHPRDNRDDDDSDDHDNHDRDNGDDISDDRPDAPDIEPPPVDVPSWSDVTTQVLTPWSCTVCHNAADPSGAVDLSSLEATAPWFVPGDPLGSRLLQVVQSGLMPPGGPPVSAEAVDILARWIEAGGQP